jgi:hypothetical protein
LQFQVPAGSDARPRFIVSDCLLAAGRRRHYRPPVNFV